MTGPFFTPDEKTRRCIERHPDWADWQIAKSANVHADAVKKIRAGLPATPQSEIPASSEGKVSDGLIPLHVIVAKYDTRAAILRELAELPADKVMTEADLCQRASGVDRYRFRRAVENCAKEFEPYRVRIKLDKDREPVWVWGHASAIEALKKAVNPW